MDLKCTNRPVSNFSRSLVTIILLLVVLASIALLSAEPAQAQCALCVTALENSPEGRGMAASFNRGILFLLAAPYAIFGTIGFVVFRAHRRKKLEAQRDNPYIPKN